ncbi:MAG: glycosyltransferase family 39 protein, partial [Patescibacteria group bacterium]
PLYLISGGNPLFVSVVFRLINALGIILIFYLAKNLFDSKVAFLSALIFAFSFEQNQYAIYVCHPPLVIISHLILFTGAMILLKRKNKFWGLPLIAIGACSAVQFELLGISALVTAAVIVFLLKDQLKKVSVKSWILAVLSGLFFLSTYLIGELKYGFRSIKSVLALLNSGYQVVPDGESRTVLYLKRLLLLFADNLLPFQGVLLILLTVLIIGAILFWSKKEKSLRLILIWIASCLFLIPLGGYNAYYVNAGIASGVIIAGAFVISKIIVKNKIFGLLVLMLILTSNLTRTIKQKDQSLIVDLKPQPYMKLADEKRLINYIYQYADGRNFTIRLINIPYRIQTVWSYLFNQYGQKVWGYLPLLETGLVDGFPGYLPQPQSGTTCLRFLIQEPTRGISDGLRIQTEKEEDLFSKVIEQKEFGDFRLQVRQARDQNCHN